MEEASSPARGTPKFDVDRIYRRSFLVRKMALSQIWAPKDKVRLMVREATMGPGIKFQKARVLVFPSKYLFEEITRKTKQTTLLMRRARAKTSFLGS